MTQPNAADAWGLWKAKNAADATGAIAGTPQYINRLPYDSTTQQGAVLTLTTAKLSVGYLFLWNSQYNYKTSALASTVLQVWFSPYWFNGDTSTFVNYMCQDTVSGLVQLTHTWSRSITTGQKDMNTALSTSSPPTSTLLGLTQQTVPTLTYSTGVPQATIADSKGFYSTSCWGARPLYLTDASYLAPLKIGNSFKFNSGFKRFQNGFLITQSSPQTTLPTFVLVDVAASSSTTSTTTPTSTSTASTASTASSTQTNAPDTWPIWKQFQPAAIVYGATSAAPQYFTRQPWDSATGQGAVFTMTTVKLTSGYMIFWNSQYNYKTSAAAGTVIQTWFSPRWYNGDTNRFVNYLCQDTIGQYGGNAGALTHTWVNTITAGVKDINTALPATGAPTATTTGLTALIASNSITFAGSPQSYVVDKNNMYSTGCYGARSLYMTEASYLAPLKVGNSFQFNSGFKRFIGGYVAAQSLASSQLLRFVVVDEASPISFMKWDDIWSTQSKFSKDMVYTGPNMYMKTTSIQSYSISNTLSADQSMNLVGQMSVKKVVYSGTTTFWWGYSTQINYLKPLLAGDYVNQYVYLYNQDPTNPLNILKFNCNLVYGGTSITPYVQTNIKTCGTETTSVPTAQSCQNQPPISQFNMYSGHAEYSDKLSNIYCVNFRGSTDFLRFPPYTPGETISFKVGFYYRTGSSTILGAMGVSPLLKLVIIDAAVVLSTTFAVTLVSAAMLF